MTWIQTVTGRRLDPFEPDVNQISIVDIAHALSMTCRFAGHTPRFYSVAEHTVEMYNLALREGQPGTILPAILLHDASEAYIADIARPLKERLPEYRKMEQRLTGIIFERFGVDPKYLKDVKRFDDAMLTAEAQALFGGSAEWTLNRTTGITAPVHIWHWSPPRAFAEYLAQVPVHWYRYG